MIDDIDLEEDAKKNVKPATLEDLQKKGSEFVEVSREIEKLEADLKFKQEQLHLIESKELPELMRSCGMQDFTLIDGQGIGLKKILKANIPSKTAIEKADEDKKPELEEKRTACFKWLRDNNLEEIIKNTLEFEFSKGQDNIVGVLIAQAEDLGIPHKREESVHSATLEKVIKEKIAKNVEVPMDTFSIYTGEKAVMKTEKKRKN